MKGGNGPKESVNLEDWKETGTWTAKQVPKEEGQKEMSGEGRPRASSAYYPDRRAKNNSSTAIAIGERGLKLISKSESVREI